MPNHCENDLYIQGPADELKRFLETIEVTDEEGNVGYSILETIVPCPEDLKITSTIIRDREQNPELYDQYQANQKKYGATNWYDWCIREWGTKWGDYETTVEDFWYWGGENDDQEGKAFITFQSAWGPPREGMLKVSAAFPTLTFQLDYFEQGMGFEGKERYVNGESEELFYNEEYMGFRGG